MTPFSIIYRIAIIIFCTEALIMAGFGVLAINIHGAAEAIVDALILTVVSGPIIYIWTIKPYITARGEAEAERVTEKRRCQRIIDLAVEAIITIDQHQRIITFNPAAERIFGYARNGVLGRPLDLLLPKGTVKEKHAAMVRAFGASAQLGKQMGDRREVRGRRKNGEEFFAQASISKQETLNGLEYTVFLQDVSDRIRAEQKLLASEARFKDFALSSSDWFWEMGPDLRFTYLSDRFEEVSGMSAQSIIGKTRQEISAPDSDDPDWVRHLADLDAHLPFKNFRYKTSRDDAKYIYFSVSGIPVFGSDGAFQGYRGIASDVTDITLSEQALKYEIQVRRETEDFLRQELEGNRLLSAVIEASPIGVTISDSTNDINSIVYCNKAFAETTGYAIDEIKGKDLFAVLEPGMHSGTWKTLDETIDNDRASLDIQSYKKDGTPFWNSLTVFPIYGTEDAVTNIVSIQMDITERVEMREEKEQMLMRALENSKVESLGTLAGGIAHEINTPIQYIGDNVTFLQNEAINFFALLDCYESLYQKAQAIDALADDIAQVDLKKQAMDMDFLREEVPLAISQSLDGVEKVANIVKAVKEFSHPGSQEMQPVSINHLIDNVTTITHNQWKYMATLTKDLDDTLPPIECNPNELNQVFVNLIINASQAIEELGREEMGTIAISSQQVEQGAEIKIGDDGPGIANMDQDRIFDLFFTTKAPGMGTGQGLAICHNIIKNHNGTIRVDSEPGKGTTFTINLPIAQPANREEGVT